MKNKYVGDFETIKSERMRVWAWGLCNLETETVTYGKTIDEFVEKIKQISNPEIYMHNLKFDGSYIMNWLFENKFEYVPNAKEKKDHSFTCLINEQNQIFYLNIFFKVGNKQVKKATFYDSYKIIPFGVEEMPKAFGLEEKKGKIDYLKFRPEGYEMSQLEKEYVKNDCLIVAKSLKYFFNTSLDRMTLGANAMKDFKNSIGRNRFYKYFPYISKECDNDLRKAYAGGYLYLNKFYKNKEVKNVTILDINSEYPDKMKNKFLPVYKGEFFEGKYTNDRYYPLYIQSFTCSFKLKENKLPTVKRDPRLSMWEYLPGEYIEDSKGKIMNLVMTNIDLKIFLEHYDVEDLKYLNGWKFQAAKGLFNRYINKWNQIKEVATKQKNVPMRTISKFMLNYLFGKFSTRIENVTKEPYFDDVNKCIKYKKTTGIAKEGVYVPISIFVTAYGREQVISTAQKIVDYSIAKYGENKYIYSDTDSIHTTLSVDELKDICYIHDTELGAWKIENTFDTSKYVKLKTYCNKKNNKFHIVCSGLSKNCLYYKKLKIGQTNNNRFKKVKNIKTEGKSKLYRKHNLVFKTKEMLSNGTEKIIEKVFEFDEFKNGFTVYGKLKAKEETGGINLIESSFTISDNSIVELLKKK